MMMMMTSPRKESLEPVRRLDFGAQLTRVNASGNYRSSAVITTSSGVPYAPPDWRLALAYLEIKKLDYINEDDRQYLKPTPALTVRPAGQTPFPRQTPPRCIPWIV